MFNFIIGFVVGAVAGVIIMALMIISKDNDNY